MAAVGAYAEAAEVTAEVKEIVLGKKAECETKAGATFEVFEPLTFVKQVVAGINYKVKVKVSEAECVHVLVYCPLPHTGEGPQLVSVEAGKKVDDKIDLINMVIFLSTEDSPPLAHSISFTFRVLILFIPVLLVSRIIVTLWRAFHNSRDESEPTIFLYNSYNRDHPQPQILVR